MKIQYDIGGIVPDSSERFDQELPDAAARRLSNQIARAYRGTFGASAGLCTIVQSVTRQMLHAGWSPDAIAQAVALHVLNHPVLVPDPREVPMGALNAKMLIDLTRKCVAEAAREASAGGSDAARRPHAAHR